LVLGIVSALVTVLAYTQGPGIVSSLTDSSEPTPYSPLGSPSQTVSPYHCDIACQVQQDKQQDAFRQGYDQGVEDANCATPKPGRYLLPWQDCANR
jgi:hypothetical protein